MTKRLTTIVAATALLLAGCGGDDDAGDGETGTDGTAEATNGAADSTGADDSTGDGGGDSAGDPETVIDDGDFMGNLLPLAYGLPPSFLTDDQRTCMNAEIEEFFPQGAVPDGYTLTDEVGAAIDAAAATCGVDLVN